MDNLGDEEFKMKKPFMEKGFIDLVKKRYSVRKYKSLGIDDNILNQILEAGRLAPSACNFQPWNFIVIRNNDTLERLWDVYPRDWFRQAPVVIVIGGDHKQSWKRADGKDHCDVDIAIAVDHMTLAAAELGLGTCWVCNFDREKCSRLLHLPENIEPIVILPLGYPDDTGPSERHISRKNVNEIVFYEKFPGK
jgi:nitroreductase